MHQQGYAQGMSMEQFLNHSRPSGGGNYLSGEWKTKKGEITVCMHTVTPFSPIRRHQFRRIFEKKGRDGEVTSHEVYTDNVLCLESEEVDAHIFRRHDDGTRKTPPTICPFCLMDEFVWQLVYQRKIDWFFPMFFFQAQGKPAEVVYAGGMTGMFGNPKLSDEEKKAIRDKGILFQKPRQGYQLRPGEDYAFRQTFRCSREWIFCVADMADLDAGMHVAIERQGLGGALIDALKATKDAAERSGKPPGYANPCINPYPIVWKYNEREMPNKKYSAICLPDSPLSGKALELVRGARPKTDHLYEVPNLKKLRMSFEAHLNPQIKLPFDQFFAPAIARFGELGQKGEKEKDATDFPHGYNAPAGGVSAQVPAAIGSSYGASTAPATMPCVVVLADGRQCGYPMPVDASACPACKTVYEETADGPMPVDEETADGGDAPGGTGWNVSGQGSLVDDKPFNPRGV